MMAGIILVVFLVFGKPTVHFFDTAALAVAITVALAALAITAAFVLAAAMSARRRRAASGGCVSCRYRCQHAMTEQPRPWPASTAERGRARSAAVPGAVGVPAGRTLLPIQPVVPRPVQDNGLELDLDLVPRWPDRPLYSVGQRAT
jgi:hypothetical protein